MLAVVGKLPLSYATLRSPSLPRDLPIWSVPVLIVTLSGKKLPSASVNVSPGPTSPDGVPQFAPSVTPIPLDGNWTFGTDPPDTAALNFRRLEFEGSTPGPTMAPAANVLHGVLTPSGWVNVSVPRTRVSDPARSVNVRVSVP